MATGFTKNINAVVKERGREEDVGTNARHNAGLQHLVETLNIKQTVQTIYAQSAQK